MHLNPANGRQAHRDDLNENRDGRCAASAGFSNPQKLLSFGRIRCAANSTEKRSKIQPMWRTERTLSISVGCVVLFQ
jgi:hypothetical protein